MSDIAKLTDLIIKFRDRRNWKQFHNPKDLAIDISLEASEVLEQFLWKDKKEVLEYVKTHKEELSDELADVFVNVLIMAHDLNIDIRNAVQVKLKKNEKKYPVEKAKGRHAKYTEL
jgi:NTP pyrophosphatase (non-canonical NTP hydrolase)